MNWRDKLHEIIFEAETPAGKLFDVLLLWAILLSVFAVLVESMSAIRLQYGNTLRIIEWGFTALFSIEYVFRLVCVRRPLSYAKSFFGIVDLLAILPSYISLFVTGAQSLLVIRALRLLRIFRILKLVRFVRESHVLIRALQAARIKIAVFLGGVLCLVLIMGSLMYLVEGEANGFTSIPRSIYWAIVTMTTVGYGDITPKTALGQCLSAIVMILGYAIIAVPTGIISVEIAQADHRSSNTRSCSNCSEEGHVVRAVFCHHCGEKL